MADLERWANHLAKCYDKDDVEFLLECATNEGKLTPFELIDLWLLACEYTDSLNRINKEVNNVKD